MILPHQDIRKLCKDGVIKNCVEDSIRENGYDIRIDKLYEPFNLNELNAPDQEWKLLPNTFYLAVSIEELNMPDELAALITLRSTFARKGFLISPTVVDAGYKGKLTIAFHSPPKSDTLRKGERFVHLIFFELRESTEKPYSGRYQGGKII
jgi:dCTP deaminase